MLFLKNMSMCPYLSVIKICHQNLTPKLINSTPFSIAIIKKPRLKVSRFLLYDYVYKVHVVT